LPRVEAVTPLMDASVWGQGLRIGVQAAYRHP
jgi:hypothetical protein